MKSDDGDIRYRKKQPKQRLTKLGPQLILCLAIIISSESIALTWEEPPEVQDSSTKQYFGIRCSQLVELTFEEIKSLIHQRNREHFREFCIPDDLLSCSDYNSYLYQLGFLKRQDGYSCRFVPKR